MIIDDNKVFIVAEISANHGNDINIVKRTISRAKEIGCDAVKIQTYTPDTITIKSDKEYFKLDSGTIWDGMTLYDLYKEAYTPWEWHEELFEYAKKEDITLFSSPFDKTAVDLLEKCNNPIYKIASFEITDIPLIEYAASKNKPMIISTGIANEKDIENAINACKKMGNNDIYLLKCSSQYPARMEDVNLLTMVDMKQKYNLKTGLSDHTEGILVATTAAAMGASIIEKHFMLDEEIEGPDTSFSMLPTEFKTMIDEIRNIERIKGAVTYELDNRALESKKIQRSLFVISDVKKGDVITEQNVRSIRPGNGMPPLMLRNVLGRMFISDYEMGTPLSNEMFE